MHDGLGSPDRHGLDHDRASDGLWTRSDVTIGLWKLLRRRCCVVAWSQSQPWAENARGHLGLDQPRSSQVSQKRRDLFLGGFAANGPADLGSRIGGAVRIRAIVIAAVLVLVGEFEIGFRQAEVSEEGVAGSHGDLPFRGVQRVR